jgi:DNA repair exonuclease SbcCD ATPase subunit
MGQELFVAYIASGDIALYTRGKTALDKLESGDVKNPYLAGLLIEPQRFENIIEYYNESNVDFALKKLNPSQKQAIIKCLNSNSIFCLQGPPGTGKTQTITELVYQYNKMGKKVLLSSQTHIAIDNVIERLPKELNILPLRLVRDRSKANAQYLPEKLLDNLYDAAYSKYKGKIDDYCDYEKNINELLRTYEDNKARYENIGKRLYTVKEAEAELNNLTQQLSKLRSEENTLNSELKGVKNQINLFSEYFRTKLPFEAVLPEFVYEPILPELNKLANKYKLEPQDDLYNYSILFKRIAGKSRIEHLNKLQQGKEKPQELEKIENEIANINSAIQTVEKLKQDSSALRSEISKKLQRKKELDRKYEDIGTNILNLSNEKFHFASSQETNSKQKIQQELNSIETFLNEWNDILSKAFNKSLYDKLVDKSDEYQAKIDKVKDEIKQLSARSSHLKVEIKEKNTPIDSERQKLLEYFNEFYLNKLHGASLPETEKEKFDEIKKYIETEKQKFEEFRTSFKKLQPIYESLSIYLEKRTEFVKQQRPRFTKTLLKNNANVYGITCTSSPYFKSSTIIGADDNRKKEKQNKENIEVDDVDIRRIAHSDYLR